MEKKPNQVTNMQELVVSWQQELSSLNQQEAEDVVIAGRIAGVVSNENFDTWYEEKADPLFIEAFNIAAALELPDGVGEITKQNRQKAWVRLQKLILALDKKYLQNHENPTEHLDDENDFRLKI